MNFPFQRPAALCGLALLALTPVARAAEAAVQEPSLVALANVPAQPVVVTATRFPENADRLPFGVSVITAEELRKSGAFTINEALMQLLGLPGRADFYGGGEYNLDLRNFGSTADANQVIVVDGLRLSEADLGGTRLSQIPLESVERIEVIRGNAAVLYGEGATAGAIVITTKAGSTGTVRNGGQVRAAAGSYGLRELRGSVTAGANGFSLDAAAQRRNADNYRDNARTELESGSVAGQWRTDSLRIGARLSADHLDARLPGGLTAAQYKANPRQTLTPQDWASIRNNRQTLFAEGQIAGWTIGFDAGWREKALRSQSGGSSSYDFDIDANNQALRARTDWQLGGMNHRFVVGLDRNEWQRKAVALSSFGPYNTTATQQSTGLYAKDDIALTANTQLALGVRSEKFKKDFTDGFSNYRLRDRLPAWDVGLTQALANGWTVFGRIGRSFRLANADEFSSTNATVPLRPQISRDIELGARWTHEHGRVEARAYRSALRDEIGYDPDAFNGSAFPGANINFDRTRRQGLEIEARQAISAALELRVNAAWRNTEFTAGPRKGRDVPLTPHGELAVNLDWTPAPMHRLGAGVQLMSAQHPDFENQCRIPGYGTVRARYAYQWNDVEFALGITNLTDRRFYTQAYRCLGGVTSSIYPEAGRAATASVAVRF